eukprot:m.216183 g.216183  ORF g.216183 m.216183 type:complete len:168 (-) comp10782_c0_seq1:6718-7221(-)
MALPLSPSDRGRPTGQIEIDVGLSPELIEAVGVDTISLGVRRVAAPSIMLLREEMIEGQELPERHLDGVVGTKADCFFRDPVVADRINKHRLRRAANRPTTISMKSQRRKYPAPTIHGTNEATGGLQIGKRQREVNVRRDADEVKVRIITTYDPKRALLFTCVRPVL